MPPVGFKPTISAGERPQTHALDRAATVTGRDEGYATIFHWNVRTNTVLQTAARQYLGCLYKQQPVTT